MRKSLLLLVICIAFTSAFAQNLGLRYGIGVGALRDHKALQSLSFGPKAIRLYPSISTSAGVVFVAEESFFNVYEMQYTLYRSHGISIQKTGMDFDELHEAGAVLHSLELPVLARFNFGSVYMEAGPQFGFNIHAKIYTNRELKIPDVNTFAFGPSFGGGISRNNILLGIRGHFGMLEYAKKTNGYPLAVQAAFTILLL
ncbi:MAG: PorT family protein [Fibromonadales bacterium]|nr:PorT family protein [Fibromonadales bacterium]